MDAQLTLPALLDNLGSSDIDTNFWNSAYSSHETKYSEREKVLDFILSAAENFKNDKIIKLLSFPGTTWAFENMLASRAECHFVGLEKSATVYRMSRRAIPGYKDSAEHYRLCLVEKQIPYGNGRILYSRVRKNFTPKSVGSRSNRLLCMDSATYLSIYFDDYGASKKEKVEFARRFYYRNAAWLDFTAQLCESVESSIKRIPFCLLDPRASPYKKPIVITVMNCRDSYHSADERIARIMALQPALEYANHWTYVGKGNVSMLTGCFYIV